MCAGGDMCTLISLPNCEIRFKDIKGKQLACTRRYPNDYFEKNIFKPFHQELFMLCLFDFIYS